MSLSLAGFTPVKFCILRVRELGLRGRRQLDPSGRSWWGLSAVAAIPAIGDSESTGWSDARDKLRDWTDMTGKCSIHSRAAFVDLSGLLSSTSNRALQSDPALRILMVEYSCLEVHVADWYRRQPAQRHSEFKGWIREGRELFDRGDELKQTAFALLRRSPSRAAT